MTLEARTTQTGESSDGQGEGGILRFLPLAKVPSEGQEATTPNQILRDALEQVRQEEGGQTESQLRQGRILRRLEDAFKFRLPYGDAFKALAAKSEEVPGLTHYTDRHLRNLALFAKTFDGIKEWLTGKAVNSRLDAEMPHLSMSHYLAVAKVAHKELIPDKKLMLLRLAKQYGWSVERLQERVNRELGISSVPWDEFGKALEKATKGIAKLTEMVDGNDSLDAGRLTSLWKLNAAIAAYGKALAGAVPEGLEDFKDSVPPCKAA